MDEDDYENDDIVYNPAPPPSRVCHRVLAFTEEFSRNTDRHFFRQAGIQPSTVSLLPLIPFPLSPSHTMSRPTARANGYAASPHPTPPDASPAPRTRPLPPLALPCLVPPSSRCPVLSNLGPRTPSLTYPEPEIHSPASQLPCRLPDHVSSGVQQKDSSALGPPMLAQNTGPGGDLDMDVDSTGGDNYDAAVAGEHGTFRSCLL